MTMKMTIQHQQRQLLLTRCSSLLQQQRRRFSASSADNSAEATPPKPSFPASAEPFDVCVIGAGPAGYAAAMRALDYKQRVCIVERGALGGTGLWNGALASKTMWEVAENYITYRRVSIGLSNTRKRPDEFTPLHIAQVHRIVHQSVAEKAAQLQHQLAVLDIPVFRGTASFRMFSCCCCLLLSVVVKRLFFFFFFFFG
jgi:hypothetical protein